MAEQPADVPAAGAPAPPARPSAAEERAVVEAFEGADADGFLRLLSRPNRREEAALVSYLGEDRYRRMHERALRRNLARTRQKPLGNVVVLHGILGAELIAAHAREPGDAVWLRPLRLLTGAIRRLELAPDGRHEADPAWTVRASAILKKHYGELLLGLSERWRVTAFFYDWRKDLRHAADALDAQLAARFPAGEQVHLVAHSMGGLVARTFILEHRKRWRALGGRLVMLGTPNYGSYDIVRTLVGRERLTRLLALADSRLSLEALLGVLNSFPGSYHLLPSPDRDPAAAALYESSTYAPVPVSERHLASAREHHERLAAVVDPERMLYVAGSGQPTFVGVEPTRLRDERGYRVSRAGDGRVPHALGPLDGVTTYYAGVSHGGLTQAPAVLDALNELLSEGSTKLLPDRPPAVRGTEGEAALRAEITRRDETGEERVRAAVRRLEARDASAGGAPDAARKAGTDGAPGLLSSAESAVDEEIVLGWLSEPRQAPAPVSVRRGPPPVIEFALAHRDIKDAHRARRTPPVDALAVGHYLGVKPQYAEAALDGAISGRRRAPREGLLTELTLRGTITGELGQPFLLPDPRDPGARVIALAGLGLPGRLARGELTVAVRELCWALGRLGCRHLAAVLIGAGTGSLEPGDAIRCWADGVAQALAGNDGGGQLERITLCEVDAARLAGLDAAIAHHAERLLRAGQLELRYRSATTRQLEAWKRAGQDAPSRRAPEDQPASAGPVATRITVSREPRGYRFGAITPTAAVPERELVIDARLVAEGNDELVAATDDRTRREGGRFLARLLLPVDLREALDGDAPIVMLLDATTARIHWELLTRPGAEASSAERPGAGELDDFLGVGAGFTRQLRTTFAPPPEPPPPPERLLRVLVVADPAEDAHLPGAEEEGLRVADLFETAAAPHADIEVVRLFGPREASRCEVLRRLLLERFHVLHFAGHCFYDPADPSASGWIFSDGEILSAYELRRIDRVPEFVFSNACESGITPDRSGERSAALAPSFAEAFFERGVGNFVCTAWPVNDAAARNFAATLYGGLLGLPEAVGGEGPLPMYRAMTEARRALAGSPSAARSWGAYQHYGDPLYRLVAPVPGSA
jgi:pimeloyl-ACP methyl ester carboxylesterase